MMMSVLYMRKENVYPMRNITESGFPQEKVSLSAVKESSRRPKCL